MDLRQLIFQLVLLAHFPHPAQLQQHLTDLKVMDLKAMDFKATDLKEMDLKAMDLKALDQHSMHQSQAPQAVHQMVANAIAMRKTPAHPVRQAHLELKARKVSMVHQAWTASQAKMQIISKSIHK